MATCPHCWVEHKRTRLCGEDPRDLAREWRSNLSVLQERSPTDTEEWVLKIAEAREEHVSEAEGLWFEYLVRMNLVHEDAQAAYEAHVALPPPAEAAGHWVGTVGQRCTMSVTVGEIKALGVHEKYGPRFLVPMTTSCGAEAVWFTGENLMLEDGMAYTVTARVEDHGTFNGKKQTRVSRVKEVT